jgi:hypothetical protein
MRRRSEAACVANVTPASPSLYFRKHSRVALTLERDDLSRWPSGIFRRAFIRAYAAGIGLDPDAIAKEFAERFPDPAELALVAPAEAPTTATAARSGSTSSSDAVLRLTLADTGTRFVPGALLAGMQPMRSSVDAGATLTVAISVCRLRPVLAALTPSISLLPRRHFDLGLAGFVYARRRRPPDAVPPTASALPLGTCWKIFAAFATAPRAARVERREDLRVERSDRRTSCGPETRSGAGLQPCETCFAALKTLRRLASDPSDNWPSADRTTARCRAA